MESAFELSEWKKTITETIDMYKRMLINPIWDDWDDVATAVELIKERDSNG